MSGFLFDPSFAGLHRVLDLRQQQHTMTASNLANQNTPGFKAKYLEFSNSLREAMDSPASAGPIEPEVIEVEAPAWATNGNSVFPEQEHARLRANADTESGINSRLSRIDSSARFTALALRSLTSRRFMLRRFCSLTFR